VEVGAEKGNCLCCEGELVLELVEEFLVVNGVVGFRQVEIDGE
jgi:hypothetical protein